MVAGGGNKLPFGNLPRLILAWVSEANDAPAVPVGREALLGIPSDIASLERNYLLADDDLDLIGTRRHPENRLAPYSRYGPGW